MASSTPSRAPHDDDDEQTYADLLPRDADTTRVVSDVPRIVLSDFRYAGAPGFLYLPSREGAAGIVFVDYLPSLRAIAAWPLWARTDAAPPPCERAPAFRVQAVAGKGAGMVATRPIAAGELIVAERPLYAARRTLSCASDQTNANGVFHRAALAGLSAAARRALLALANAYPAGEYDVVPGLLNTNCLEIRLPGAPAPGAGADAYAGCFPTLARANHDCTPSANYTFAPGRFAGELRATRGLRAGEEITVSYAPLGAPRAERAAFLARTRFFACACATCALPPDARRASDARRMKIRALLQRMEGARFPPRIPLEELVAALQWAREEGLPVEEGRILLCGSQVLTVYDGLGVAMDWAQEARRVFEMVEGDEAESLKRLDEADRVHRAMATNRRTTLPL